MLVEEIEDPRHWYSTNLVGLPSQLLSSTYFNACPRRLRIAATRQTHAGLFALLERAATQAEAALIFGHHMQVEFDLSADASSAGRARPRQARSTYVKVLQGWGFDANAAAGAVLKGWVESRFGIVPTFHRAPLAQFPSVAWMRYLEEKLSSRFHNHCIQLQLDLLFEYAQWSLERFTPLGLGRHAALYRGINASEVQLVRGSLRERRGIIRLNNLVSFSTCRERAEEFGDVMVAAQVPLAKVLFFPGLIHDRVLNGEGEVLVLGGDFEVQLSYV